LPSLAEPPRSVRAGRIALALGLVAVGGAAAWFVVGPSRQPKTGGTGARTGEVSAVVEATGAPPSTAPIERANAKPSAEPAAGSLASAVASASVSARPAPPVRGVTPSALRAPAQPSAVAAPVKPSTPPTAAPGGIQFKQTW